MAGIGGQEASGKLVTVQAELPEDIDDILDAVRRIVMLGEVQTITLKSGEPITYQRLVRAGEEIRPEESTQSYAELTPYEIIRNVPMEEWAQGVGTPHSTVMDMFLAMGLLGWMVTHLVLAENTEFWKWLDIPPTSTVNIKQFLGARIERSKELPSGVFILCGAKTRHATIAEVGMALKGTTYEQGTDAEDN
jgi:hypothetical protein